MAGGAAEPSESETVDGPCAPAQPPLAWLEAAAVPARAQPAAAAAAAAAAVAAVVAAAAAVVRPTAICGERAGGWPTWPIASSMQPARARRRMRADSL